MKILNKILSLIISAAVLASVCGGLSAFAAEPPLTGARLKEMAECRKLSESPDAEQILNLEYQEQNPELAVTEQKVEKVGDYIDPDSAFMMYLTPAQGITKFFRDGGGNAKSFAEAFDLFKNSEYCVEEYWQRVEPFYDEHGQIMNARNFQVQYSDGKLNDVMPPAAADFRFEDKYYDLAADAVNKSDIREVSAVYTFMNEIALDTDKGSFVMPCETVTNGYAAYLGYGEIKLDGGTLYPVLDYDNFYSLMSQYAGVASELFEKRVREAIGGMPTQTEVEQNGASYPEDTDSFSRYIGTEPRYSDITAEQAAVTNQMSDLGVITGENGLFRPNDRVTRAETAAMLCRLFDIEPSVSSGFSDVPDEYWAAGQIASLAEQGVINGFEDGSFGPEEPVTYEQALKMIENLLGYSSQSTLTYGEYPEGEIIVGAMLGLTDDMPGFDSGDPVSRIETACMLSRALDTHILTECYYFTGSSMGFGSSGVIDKTLADWKNGAELSGEYFRSSAAFEARKEALENELNAKCGDIFREYHEATGLMSGKVSFGLRMMPKPIKSNPVPRIQ